MQFIEGFPTKLMDVKSYVRVDDDGSIQLVRVVPMFDTMGQFNSSE